MNTIDWNSFWNNYRALESRTERDLFFQVGKTVNKEPVSEAVFNAAFEDIVDSLSIKSKDTVLEMCCGNGLVTFPLSQITSKIYAFDFAPHLIEAAKRLKQNNTIEYKVGDAKASFLDLFSISQIPNKFLMNDALGYFSPNELLEILQYIIAKAPRFSFYLTGVPNDALKWNFYDTDERKETYLKGVENGDESNNGMGRWWKKSDLLQIAEGLGLKITLKNQISTISNYRMDVLFEKE
ncbi:class I SAM-dependent methyltransferase [Flavobacterium qiangtangense]|uniref:Class I SAM-dependent methyltransferase n=1 Tax=Flavobacterium qiangtangense TaxID=1442595 RepID=A0ABW1PTD5_9FLAO